MRVYGQFSKRTIGIRIFLLFILSLSIPALALDKNAAGMVLVTRGKPEVILPGAKQQPLIPMDTLALNAIVATSKNSHITFVHFSDNVEYSLEGDSRIQLIATGIKPIKGSYKKITTKIALNLPDDSKIYSRRIMGASNLEELHVKAKQKKQGAGVKKDKTGSGSLNTRLQSGECAPIISEKAAPAPALKGTESSGAVPPMVAPQAPAPPIKRYVKRKEEKKPESAPSVKLKDKIKETEHKWIEMDSFEVLYPVDGSTIMDTRTCLIISMNYYGSERGVQVRDSSGNSFYIPSVPDIFSYRILLPLLPVNTDALIIARYESISILKFPRNGQDALQPGESYTISPFKGCRSGPTFSHPCTFKILPAKKAQQIRASADYIRKCTSAEEATALKLKLLLVYMDNKLYYEAVSLGEELKKTMPDNPYIDYYLAAAYYNLGCSDKALSYYEKYKQTTALQGKR